MSATIMGIIIFGGMGITILVLCIIALGPKSPGKTAKSIPKSQKRWMYDDDEDSLNDVSTKAEEMRREAMRIKAKEFKKGFEDD